jgi:hypothetical protein
MLTFFSLTRHLEYRVIELAEEIRKYVYENYVKPAKISGEKSLVIVSGEVHDRMGLKQRMPLVCSVLRGSKFQGYAGIQLVNEIGPPGVETDSSTNKFVFNIK